MLISKFPENTAVHHSLLYMSLSKNCHYFNDLNDYEVLIIYTFYREKEITSSARNCRNNYRYAYLNLLPRKWWKHPCYEKLNYVWQEFNMASLLEKN